MIDPQFLMDGMIQGFFLEALAIAGAIASAAGFAVQVDAADAAKDAQTALRDNSLKQAKLREKQIKSQARRETRERLRAATIARAEQEQAAANQGLGGSSVLASTEGLAGARSTASDIGQDLNAFEKQQGLLGQASIFEGQLGQAGADQQFGANLQQTGLFVAGNARQIASTGEAIGGSIFGPVRST